MKVEVGRWKVEGVKVLVPHDRRLLHQRLHHDPDRKVRQPLDRHGHVGDDVLPHRVVVFLVDEGEDERFVHVRSVGRVRDREGVQLGLGLGVWGLG